MHYAEACSSGVRLQDGLEPRLSRLDYYWIISAKCKTKLKLYAGNFVLMTICFLL